MATFPSQSAFNAAQLNIVGLYASRALTQSVAPTHHGTDFRLTAGTERWQIHVRPDGIEIGESNITYYRVRVTILMHHLITSIVDEVNFIYKTMDQAFVYFYPSSIWTAKAHIYNLADEDGDPESSDIEREGNVLTWTFGITLLVDNQPWAVALAIGTQGAFGTVDPTIAALDTGTWTPDSTDGFVLGDKNSGDAESGITIPNFERIVREVAKIEASFTEQADAFLRTAVNGLAITLPTQGNGLDAGAPDASAASLVATLPGRDAIYQCAGLTASAGAAAPDVDYDPRASEVYTSIKLWIGGKAGATNMSYVFRDCIIESLAWVCTPGGNVIETSNLKVGALETAAVDVAFPAVAYGTQASMAAPVVEGVAFAGFGQTRGFENLTVTCSNTIEEYQDSNIATTGIRQAQTRRQFLVDGTLYINDTDVDAAYAQLASTSAPTNDMTFQVGDPDVGGAETALNAFLFSINNVEAKDIKYNRIGSALAVELSGCKATSTTQGEDPTRGRRLGCGQGHQEDRGRIQAAR
jgi:hypothetical protein